MTDKKIGFDPLDFAEFLGSRGKNVTIVEQEGITEFKTEPMKIWQFQELLQEYTQKIIEKEGLRMLENNPKAVVKLTGEDGNAFMILGRVLESMKRIGWSEEDRKAFLKEAKSGDYDHLLRTVMKYCEVE